jgi:hypothetical protein
MGPARRTTMTPRYVALVAAGVLLAGCGSRAGSPETGPYSPVATTNTLTVRTQIAPGQHGMMFIEGAVPEIRLIGADGTAVSPERDHRATALFSGLAPGTYRLHAALRPCDGNCGYLDGPTAPCAGVVRVPVDGVVDVTWRVGRSCHVIRGR